MKKRMALFAAATVSFSLFALSACGFVGGPVNNDGTITGNYRPASDIEILQVVNSIRQDKVFGDVNADEWNFGLEYATDRLISLRSGETNWKEKANSFYRLVLERDEEDAMQMRGSGYGSMELTAPAGVYADGEVQLINDDSLCNDEQFLYHDELLRWQGLIGASDELNRGKEPLAMQDFASSANALFGLPLRLMADIVHVAQGGETESKALSEISWDDALAFREQLQRYGITPEVDLNNGVKLRLSATEETVRLALASVISESVEAAEQDIVELAAALPIRFVQCAYDIYFAVDDDGVFSGIGVRADIEIVVEDVAYDLATGLPLEDEESFEEIRLTIRGMERLSVYGGDVTLPDDFDDYAEPGETDDAEDAEDAAEELPETDGEAVGSEEEGDDEPVVLPTETEFRATVGDAFDKLWEELYGFVAQGAQEDVASESAGLVQ